MAAADPHPSTPRYPGFMVKTSTIHKTISVLMTYVALMLVMVGFDIMAIVMSQFYLAGCGITAFNGLYAYQWGTVLGSLLLCVCSVSDCGKEYAAVPYLAISVS